MQYWQTSSVALVKGIWRSVMIKMEQTRIECEKSFVCTFVTTQPFSRRNNLICRRCTNELGWITIVDYDDFMGKFARSGKIQPRSCRYSIYVACILQLMMIFKSCIWLYIVCFAFCFTGTVFLLIYQVYRNDIPWIEKFSESKI